MRFWLWMRTHCGRCGRWTLFGRYCRDFDACIERERVLTIESRFADLILTPRDHYPLDREGMDWQRPADLDVCHVCHGKGERVIRQDWETGAWDTSQCRWCDGTGEEPVAPGFTNWHPEPHVRRYWARLRDNG